MSEKTIKICDICKMDGEEERAIGWYEADDGELYDICEKHAKLVKESGKQLHEYDD